MASSTPRDFQVAAFSGLRTMARTCLPWARRLSATADPTCPVIPMTAYMQFSFGGYFGFCALDAEVMSLGARGAADECCLEGGRISHVFRAFIWRSGSPPTFWAPI